MVPTASAVERFEAARPRLEAIAYRLLGSASGAEDAVQETFLRWHATDPDRIKVPEAWLTRVLTNLCLNQLTSAAARRQSYVGQWLPEPLLSGDPMLGPAETVEQRESLSYAVMVLLDSLSPHERAVYVLREAFGHSHREIAGILDVSEAASQQLLHRARQHVAVGRARAAEPLDADARVEAERIVEEFLTAATSGRVEPLVRLLTTDAVVIGDGGGKVPAAARAFVGGQRVATFLRGLFKPGKGKQAFVGESITMEPALVNGDPAVVASTGDRLFGVLVLQVGADGIAAVRTQVNPDKLGRISRTWAALDRHPAARELPL